MERIYNSLDESYTAWLKSGTLNFTKFSGTLRYPALRTALRPTSPEFSSGATRTITRTFMQNRAVKSPKNQKTRQQPGRLFWLRPMLRWVAKLRSSPSAIAGGLAMGTFMAFTPTVGLQFIAVVVLATVFNLNRPAAIAPIWITNPFTIAPIYTFNYWVGLQFCDGPPLRQVSGIFVNIGKAMAKMEIWQVQEQVKMMFDLGREIIVPLVVGSCVVGIVCGAIVYIAAIKMLVFLFTRKEKKRLKLL